LTELTFTNDTFLQASYVVSINTNNVSAATDRPARCGASRPPCCTQM